MASEGKYGGRSKGLWRKVYGYSPNKPQVDTIVDTATATSRSIDLNQVIRHRDYFIIDGITGFSVMPTPPVFYAEYDEGLINLFNTDFSSGSFNFSFTQRPIVVLTVEGNGINDNIQVYGLTLNQSGFTFGTSAPFSGSIRYRAIHSNNYIAFASSAYTSSITASAGAANPNGSSTYTAAFAALPGAPFKFYSTSWDLEDLQDVDISHEVHSINDSSATIDFSSTANSTVHYIAFYST